MTAATTAAASQELSQSGKSPDPSRAGTKYPVQEIPHFDIYIYIYILIRIRYLGLGLCSGIGFRRRPGLEFGFGIRWIRL